MSYVLPTALSAEQRESRGAHRAWSVLMLLVFLLIGLACGVIGVVVSRGAALGWYPPTPRVSWTPPMGVLTTVRTAMFVLMAVAEWLMWRRRAERPVGGPLGLFVAQQAISTGWPVLFFAGYSVIGLADLWLVVVVLLLLDLLVLATAAAFWSTSRAASIILALHLTSTLVSTALVLGSAAMHALL